VYYIQQCLSSGVCAIIAIIFFIMSVHFDFARKKVLSVRYNISSFMPSFEISVPELLEKIRLSEPLILLDIREPYELEDTGIIPGSLSLPMGNISHESLKTLGIQPESEIILICHSGGRAERVCDALVSAGYPHAKTLVGGIGIWILLGQTVGK